jgi:hypothetical protein
MNTKLKRNSRGNDTSSCVPGLGEIHRGGPVPVARPRQGDLRWPPTSG